MDEIDAFLDIDTSMDINEGYHDSEGDIIYLESLLTNETTPSLPSGVFLDRDTKRLKDESVIDDSKNMVKIFDPGILVSPFLLSSGSEDTIFDPDVSAFHFSHWSGTYISFNVYPNIFNESPMEISSSTCFTPNITMIWGESSKRLAQKQ
nr:hypothetical protein [Tanacetum cinerariifolium]